MTRDRLTALISIVFGATIIYLAKTTIGAPIGMMSRNDPGATMFPIIAGIVMVAAGVGLFITSNKQRPSYFGKEEWINLGKVSLVFAAYVVCMKLLGFLVSTVVFLFVLSTLFLRGKKASILVRVVYSVVCSGAIYYIFRILLKLPLPTGLLI